MLVNDRPASHAFAAAALAAAAAVVMGCGGSEGSEEPKVRTTDAAALEMRIERERKDAAQAARQQEQIRTLREQVRALRRERKVGAPPRVVTVPGRAPEPTTSVGSSASNWPAGVAAWTVVLASVTSRAEAENARSRAASAGLPQTGVLFSSDYASLRPGWWVAYSGVMSNAEAVANARRARGVGFADAYQRFVSDAG